MKKINQNKLFSSLIYSIINLLLMLVLINNKSNLNLTTYLSALQLVISLILIKVNKQNIISIATIFLLFSYLFHFGQSVIIAFGFNDIYAHRSILSITSNDLYVKAMYFAMISHCFVTLGIVWSKPYNSTMLAVHDNEDLMLKKLRTVSFIVLAITLFPLIYLDIQKIFAVKTGGYLSTYDTYAFGINKYLNLFAQFARPAITMLIISFKNYKKKAKIVFGISSIYFIIMMISGDRGTNLIFLLTNIFVFYKIIIQIKIKTVLVILVFAYFFLGFITSISILRDTSQISIEGLIYYYKYRSADGIIYSTLREFGSTIKTLIYAIQFTTEISDYNYGLTYVWSWLNISPKLPESVVNYLSADFTFTRSFPVAYQDSLGGSYLGELYYNFGWMGSALAFFVGRFIGKINDTIESSVNNKNWLLFSILMILFPNIILWVRGYFVELLFKVFWLGLFTIVIYYSTKKSKMEHINESKINVK